MKFRDVKQKAIKLWNCEDKRYGLTFTHWGEPFVVYRGCTYEPRLEELLTGVNPESNGWDVRFTTEEEFWKELEAISWALKGPNYFYC